MATIISKPGSIAMSGNIKDIIVDSSTEINFVIQEVGGSTILEETYQPDANNKITIRLRDLLPSLLSLQLPTSDVFEQANAVKNYNFIVEGTAVPTKVVFGGVDADTDPEVFLKGNWLTWQPQQKKVKFNDPEWLSYHAVVTAVVKVKAYFKDKDPETITLASLPSGKTYSLNMNFGYLSGKFTGQPVYFDVWNEDTVGTQLAFVQRFVLFNDYFEHEDLFVVDNSLGGLDTFRFTGKKEDINDFEIESALFDEDTMDYDVEFEKYFKKNTGYFLDDRYRTWTQEFFNSLKRYYCADTGYQSITVSKPKAKSVQGDITTYNYDFEFALSRQTKYLNLSRANELPTEVQIVDPDSELFFLASRLSEFPSAILNSQLLIPVQVPFTEKWEVTNYGAIRSNILSEVAAMGFVSGDEVGSHVDLSAYALVEDLHEHANKAFLDTLALDGNYLESNNGEVWVANADRLGNLAASNYWTKQELINDALYLKVGADKIKAGYADLAFNSDRLGNELPSAYWKKAELVNDSLYLKISGQKIKAGYADLAYDSERLGNILAADHWNKFNSDIASKSWTMYDAIVHRNFVTSAFAPGIIGGVGAKIDQSGHGEMKSLDLREFLRTPELIKNQVRVAGNQFWFTDPGLIKDVSGTGPYTLTLKIEEGDGVSFKVDDILIGIFNHDTGFETCYLDVVSVDLENNQVVVNSRNGISPRKFMQLARKGNETNTDRQTSVFVDGLNGFVRVLGGVNDHNTTFNNIIAQLGYLNMHSPVFGDMEKGLYVKDFGYFENVRVSGEIHVTGGNAETQTGAQDKADAAEAAATGVANAAQTKADSAYNLADLKITESDAVTITHREIKAPYIATLGLTVGDEILMGPNAVIAWDKVTGTENMETISGAQDKADAAESAATGVANSAQTTANEAKSLAESKTDAWVTTITQNTITSEFIAALNLKVGDQIQMGENAVITWDSVTGVDQANRNFCTAQPNYEYSGNTYPFFGEHLYKPTQGIDLGLYPGNIITVSADVKINQAAKDAGAKVMLYMSYGNPDGSYGSGASILSDSLSWVREKFSINVPSNASYIWVGVYHYPSSNNGGTAFAKNIKVELGSKATHYVANDIYFAQNKANSAYSLAETKTDAWVTTITQNTVTSAFIAALNLEVGNQIAMGANAAITWNQVTGTQNVETILGAQDKADAAEAAATAVASAAQNAADEAKDAAIAARRNLISHPYSYRGWGSPTDWSPYITDYAGTQNNACVLDPETYGANDIQFSGKWTMITKGDGVGTETWAGGFTFGDNVNYNDDQTYMFAMWVYKTESSGAVLFGVNGGVNTLGGTYNGNAYFRWGGTQDFAQNGWMLWVGYIRGKNTVDGVPMLGACYNKYGKKIYNNTDYKWVAGNTNKEARVGFYHGATGKMMIQNPQVYVCDGSEPSISDLIDMNQDILTTITNDTIATTTVIAEQMKVRAINIIDQLTAAQINFDNAFGNNVTLTGKFTSNSQTYSGNIVIDGAHLYRTDGDDDSRSLSVNWYGYNGDTTRYRDFYVYDGRAQYPLLACWGKQKKVRVGTDALPDAVNLEVYGDLDVDGAIHWGTPSDKSLKKKIKTINNPLKALRKTRPVTFYYKEGEQILHRGFIAQEIQEVFPEFVSKRKDGKLRINTIEMIAQNTAGILQNDTRITLLKKEVEYLKSKLKKHGITY